MGQCYGFSWFFILSVFFSLLVGCRDATIITTNHGSTMKFDSLKIKDLRVVPWTVGKGFLKQSISKGFIVSINFPELNRQELMELYKKKRVDSWIIKVERNTVRKGKEVIGYFMVPLRVQTNKGLRISSSRLIRFRVYYAAASVSPRFQLFSCPAFEHNLQMVKFDIRKARSVQESIAIRRMNKMKGKIESAGFASLEFNGGMSLKGEYTTSVALFNSDSRVFMSEYVPVRDTISVTGERPVVIRGCGNFIISDRDEQKKEHSLKKIKFK